MRFQAEFDFLQKILRKQRMHCHLIVHSQGVYPEFDLGLRKFLNNNMDYASLCAQVTDYAQPNTIFRLQDSFMCNYYLLALPDPEVKPVLFVGPYVSREITSPMVLELAERLMIEPPTLVQLKKYYSDLPFVADETWFFSLLSSFGETIWGGLENFHVEDVERTMSDQLTPVAVRPEYFEPEEAFISMKVVEDRYELENRFMKAVSQGLTHKAITVTAENSFYQLEKRLRDPVRDLKNYSIVLNTLLRKAAEAGGVHPLHIDSLSSRYARRIELVVSIPEGRALQKEMIHKYCLLVKNHSVHGYSLLVQKVLTRVDTDLTADLSLKTHADLLNVNPSYLSSLFKKEVGVTLTDYVTRKRIDQAIFLLNSTQLQVQTVAQYCGMPDVNYFTKTFKKLIGKTPKEYRKSIS